MHGGEHEWEISQQAKISIRRYPARAAVAHEIRSAHWILNDSAVVDPVLADAAGYQSVVDGVGIVDVVRCIRLTGRRTRRMVTIKGMCDFLRSRVDFANHAGRDPPIPASTTSPAPRHAGGDDPKIDIVVVALHIPELIQQSIPAIPTAISRLIGEIPVVRDCIESGDEDLADGIGLGGETEGAS